jgi:alpha-glucosidase
MWFQDSVHEIFRSWRKILDSYDGDRAMCGEAYVLPLSFMALWVRPDEFHQTFNFRFLDAGWDKEKLISAITESFEAFDSVGAPSTWVLNNHDVVRHASRFGGDYGRATASDGIGPNDPQPNAELGLMLARASTLFMLGLPGASYLYQGEELGLPEHTTLEPEYRQDPTFARTAGARVGRDGCRVPLPWEAGQPSLGFGPGHKAWLPQPASYQKLARDKQEEDSSSTLNLYKNALAIRKQLALGEGSFDWVRTGELLSYQNQDVLVVHNFGPDTQMPKGELLVSSDANQGDLLKANQTIWLRV